MFLGSQRSFTSFADTHMTMHEMMGCVAAAAIRQSTLLRVDVVWKSLLNKIYSYQKSFLQFDRICQTLMRIWPIEAEKTNYPGRRPS